MRLVCCIHYTCKASQGETCTHVASLLFYLEASTRIQGKVQPVATQESCYWIIPSYLKEVEYLPMKDINFTSRGMKRTLGEQIQSLAESKEEGNVSESDADEKSKKVGTISSEEDLSFLFKNLSVACSKLGLLSVVPAHSDQFVPTSPKADFLQPLMSLTGSK